MGEEFKEGSSPLPEKGEFVRLNWRVLVNSERYYDKMWGRQFAAASPTSNSGGLVPLFSVISAPGTGARRARAVRGCVVVTCGRGSVL